MAAVTASSASVPPPMLLLSEAAVRASLSMADAIHVNAQAFLAAVLGEGQAHVPPYAAISAPASCGSQTHASDATNVATLFKPALIEEALGIKVVAVRPANDGIGLPTVPAVILLNDRVTGFPVALLQATYLTALRTAAGSGAATEMGARADASVLAVFGAGMQAHAHVQAMLCVRDIKQVHIINRSAGRAEELVAALRREFPAVSFTVHASSERSAEATAARTAAIRSAHIICTTTNSSTPLLQLADVSPGVHINAVGSYLPHMSELSPELVSRCRIAIDGAAALHSGDLAVPIAAATLEEAVLRTLGCFLDIERYGKPRQGTAGQDEGAGSGGQVGFTLRAGPDGFTAQQWRTSDDDLTLFKSVGMATQDVATAYAVLQRARSQRRGKVAQWE